MNIHATTTDPLDLYGINSSHLHYNTLLEPQEPDRSTSSMYIPDQRIKRTKIQRMVKTVLNRDKHSGVCSCGSIPIPLNEVQVIKTEDDKVSLRGLQTCRSTFLCPVCEQRNAYKKATTLLNLMQETHNYGGDVVQVILTIHHRRGQDLLDLQTKLKSAFDAVFAPSKKGSQLTKQFGLVGYHLTKEITFSLKHGWHPHFHVTLFFNRNLNSTDIYDLEAFIKKEFPAAAVRQKRYTSPNAINVRHIDLSDRRAISNAAFYATKPAAVGISKRKIDGSVDTEHLSIWQVIELMNRVKDAGNTAKFKELYAVFQEYACTMKRKRSVSISRRLKLWLKTNTEYVDNDVEEEPVNNYSNIRNCLDNDTMQVNPDFEVSEHDVDTVLSVPLIFDGIPEPRVVLIIGTTMWYAIPKASEIVSKKLGKCVNLLERILAACQREDASLKALQITSKQCQDDCDTFLASRRLIRWFRRYELRRFRVQQKALTRRKTLCFT